MYKRQVLRSSDYWDDFDVPVGPYFVIIEPSSDQVIDEGLSLIHISEPTRPY